MALRRWLRLNVFGPLIARRDGIDVWRWLPELRRELEAAADPKRREIMQVERCGAILRYAHDHSEFFREHFARHGFHPDEFRDLRDLRRVPVFEKSHIPGSQRRIRSAAIASGELVTSATGGTTGNSFAFWLDRSCWERREVMDLLANERLGWRVGDPVAIVWNAHQDLPGRVGLKRRLRNWLAANQTLLDATHIDEARLAAWCDLMRRRRVEVLYGYAQSVREIVAYLDATGGALPDLRLIVTTAEPLYAADRELIARVVGCEVRDRYASREHGPMAQEREPGRLEIFANSLVLEIDGEPGKVGDILVTDLWNRAFPFIRYRIGDTASLLPPPAAGLPELGPLSGRQTDFLIAEDGSRVSGMTFHEVYYDPARGDYGSDRFATIQFAQVAARTIEIRIVPGPDHQREEDEARLTELVHHTLGAGMDVRYRYVEEIPRSASGKFRFTVNEMTD